MATYKNGFGLDGIDEYMAAETAEVRGQIIVDSQSPFTANLLKSVVFPEIKFVVPGYITEGVTIFAGKPKLGKSWFCLDVAIAVATGGIALGSPCDQGDVLYLALEDNPRRLQGRMRRLSPFVDWPERLTFATAWKRLHEGGIADIEEWCDGAENPRLVIIDTLKKVRHSRDQNDSGYDDDYKAIEALHAFASARNIAILLVHHTRKMDADDPIDTVSGTLGLTAAADAVLVLNRSSNGVILYGRGRDVEEIETAVEFDKERFRWKVLGAAAEVFRSDERSTILEVLGQSKEPMTPADISAATGFPSLNVRQLLFKMATAGEVEKVGRGCYRHPCYTDNNDNNDNNGELA